LGSFHRISSPSLVEVKKLFLKLNTRQRMMAAGNGAEYLRERALNGRIKQPIRPSCHGQQRHPNFRIFTLISHMVALWLRDYQKLVNDGTIKG